MTKIYKTDFGSLSYIIFSLVLFISLGSITLFAFGGAPLNIKLGMLLLVVSLFFFFYNMLKYKVVIDNEGITAHIPLLSFLNKYRMIKFDEVERVYNEILPFPEMTNIVLVSKNKLTKPIRIMVGFGLPWDVLLDILERLPKDVKIDFEPLLWKIIKNPVTSKKAKKINLIMGVVIALIIIWFLYFLYSIAILRRVAFPINYFIGQ